MASPDKTSTPTPSHANWSTAPLVPRKSPERRRLALGHKSTQSLDLPRLSAFTLRDALLKLKDNVEEKTAQSGLIKPDTTLADETTKSDQDTASIPPTANDPLILSPRPRRYTADVRALENAQLLADKLQTPLPHDTSKSEDRSLSASRLGRPATQGNTDILSRRHVRNAHSLSPVRHERMQSQQYPLGSYERGEYQGGRPRLHHLLVSPQADMKTESQKFEKSTHNHRLEEELGLPQNRPERAATMPSPREENKSYIGSPITDATDDITILLNNAAACPSDESFGTTLLDNVPGVQESEASLDWAVDVLRLCDRKAARQHHLTAGTSATLSKEFCEAQRIAIEIVEYHSKNLASARAMFLLGSLLESGRGNLIRDRPAALKLYKEASWFGYGRADYRLGVQFEKLGDMKKACESYERGASVDDSACLYRMGMILYMGHHGYDRDQAQGINCIHLSALSADCDAPQGAHVWALLLAGETTFAVTEEIMKKSSAEAVRFFEKSALLGLAAAQLRMGKAHEFNELGCAFSPALSWHYYTLAANGDNPEADMAISKWALAGSEDGTIPRDERKAFHHAALAASRGLASAEFAMGYFYEVGIACAQDLVRAQTFYRRAVEHGSEEAQSRIEGLSRSKTLSREDHEHHVSTRIHARHATIKLNQKLAARYRDRSDSPAGRDAVPSLPLQRSESHSPQATITNLTKDQQMEPSAEHVVNNLTIARKPVNQSPSMKISNLWQSRAAQSGTQRISPMNSDEVSENLAKALQSTTLHQVVEPSHKRNQSWMPQASRWAAPESRKGGSVDLRNRGGLDSMLARDQCGVFEQERNRIQDWNQHNESHSVLGSPNLAPSELGSVLEGPLLPSPRPESSVSNIQPFRLPEQLSLKTGTPSVHSQVTIPRSVTSSNIAPSSATSISQPSSRRAGPATFEEMGIPIANKKKEECVMM